MDREEAQFIRNLLVCMLSAGAATTLTIVGLIRHEALYLACAVICVAISITFGWMAGWRE